MEFTRKINRRSIRQATTIIDFNATMAEAAIERHVDQLTLESIMTVPSTKKITISQRSHRFSDLLEFYNSLTKSNNKSEENTVRQSLIDFVINGRMEPFDKETKTKTNTVHENQLHNDDLISDLVENNITENTSISNIELTDAHIFSSDEPFNDSSRLFKFDHLLQYWSEKK